ncbi:DNA methyltransferase [Enterococcus gallinarum]|uniref:DNA methyltransferase n=1 Tax=Enterococcus gallinarum TaxID=1353 RepID=UPI0012E18727|nr:DNA methyltransferase [Enterococcus gallinarum]MUN91319.1 site-specific DNA-methyltransferase [Enterococcus gallinarum]
MKNLDYKYEKTCSCNPKYLSCITPKEWMKSQIGVWTFNYESRDIRDKKLHPATFPISLAVKVISLFSHEGELVLDPFSGSGTTLLAAKDLNRNAIGFDINPHYCELAESRVSQLTMELAEQFVVNDDARSISDYISPKTVKLVITSPPYANILNRKRKNKSRRGDKRKNEQYDKIEQYSQNENDLGTLSTEQYEKEIETIFKGIKPLMTDKGHVIINITDAWIDGHRSPLHINIINAMQKAGYEFRNTIIWDRRNIVNQIGIFGWPSSYITMGTTFEYILDFIPQKETGD